MQDSLGRPAFAGRSGSGTAMARIQIGGAGGAPSNNFIRSLRESARHDHIIGTNSIPSDLFLAEVDEKYVVPPASSPLYPDRLLTRIGEARPDFLHLQRSEERRVGKECVRTCKT